MGTIVATENASLDGVIEQVGDWFAPAGAVDADDSDIVATLREQMDAQAALLLGRKTFEAFRGSTDPLRSEPLNRARRLTPDEGKGKFDFKPAAQAPANK
jgi:hypothetical protein